MKHILLIITFISVTSLFGQDFKKVDYQFDFGTSMTIPYKKSIERFPNIDNPKTDYSSSFGYFFEFIGTYNLNSTFSIYSGINYQATRLGINDMVGAITNTGYIATSYLNIPIFFKYHVLSSLSISAGSYIGVLISAKEKGTTYIDLSVLDPSDPILETIDPTQDYNNNISRDYKKYDFGLSSQLDYEIGLSDKLSGIIFTRLNYGLINVITNDISTYNSAKDWKNINLLLGIGIKI
ncbi:MAG: PorT family protein [Salinivirgaceae bacterium]|nr:PorT family protein [Salinivirgaceae bacterium]